MQGVLGCMNSTAATQDSRNFFRFPFFASHLILSKVYMADLVTFVLSFIKVKFFLLGLSEPIIMAG